MKISSEQLGRHLRNDLGTCYLCLNGEPLLLNEDRDRIREALACEERNLFFVDSSFDFADARAATGGSLFSKSSLLEFICVDPINAKVASQLVDIARVACSTTPLIVGAPALARRGKWTEELEEMFVVVTGKKIEFERMTGWIKARAKKAKTELDDEAAELIASLTEGNPGMAAQELDKLAMIHGEGASINYSIARESCMDHTRDGIDSLRESLAAGSTVRALRALRNLKSERIAPPLVVWALAEEGRALLALTENVRPWGVFGSHRSNLAQLARRVRKEAVLAWLAAVARADWAAKGLQPGLSVWILCARLAAAFTVLAKSNQLPENLLDNARI